MNEALRSRFYNRKYFLVRWSISRRLQFKLIKKMKIVFRNSSNTFVGHKYCIYIQVNRKYKLLDKLGWAVKWVCSGKPTLVQQGRLRRRLRLTCKSFSHYFFHEGFEDNETSILECSLGKGKPAYWLASLYIDSQFLKTHKQASQQTSVPTRVGAAHFHAHSRAQLCARTNAVEANA